MSNLGSEIDKLHALREKKRKLEKEVEDVKHQMAEQEEEIMARMQKENITRATGSKANVSVSENVRPTVQDWDAFYNFIHRNKMYHLLDRRPSVSGCRELFETKGMIPGVVPFKQKTLRLNTEN